MFSQFMFAPTRLNKASPPFSRAVGAWRRAPLFVALLAAFSGSASAASDVVISQVYGGGGNANAVYKNDFIELFNRGATAVNLGGWSVQYASAAGNTWTVTALPGVSLLPGAYLLVQQASSGANGASLPAPDVMGSTNLSASAGKVLLAAKTTAVTSASDATILDLVGFGSSANASEGAAAASPSATTAILRVAKGCTDSDHNDTDFAAGPPTPRNLAAPPSACGGSTPGTMHTIPQLQGSGASSPYVGTQQTTEGVVTLKLNNGFYMQDPLGDGDPTTSDGIFVYTGNASSAVKAGDRVRVSATVVEFNAGDATRPVTELSTVANITVQSSGNTVTPTNIGLPMPNAAGLERYEGMLVRFTNPLTVSQNYFLGRYGQLTLSAGRLEHPTNRYAPGSSEAVAAMAANAANQIVLDDGLSTQNPNPIPYIGADNTVRAGDTVHDLTGVIDFGLTTSSNPGPAGYKLQPTAAPVFSRDNPRSLAPVVAAGDVRVASVNVLNFFTTFTNGETADGQSGQGCLLNGVSAKSNCRGANNAIEFARQRDKIVMALKAINADVFGLMEIQNQGDTTVANLVAGLNSVVGAGTYAVVPEPPAQGGTGSDAIRVAMIYKPGKLKLAGPSLSDVDPINNRPPMAQTFATGSGEKFSVIVNHMKSKSSCPLDGSDDDDQGDGQGCWNARRVLQAQRLANVFIPQVQAAAQNPDVLVIGDMNSYGAEAPIKVLEDKQGLVNEIERFVRPASMPYSFVFDGESGYLDHALATASLDKKVAGVTEWHINADEPSVIDYNTEFKPQDLYAKTPYRASDHDPVVISLNLAPPPAKAVDVTSKLTLSSSALKYDAATKTYRGTFGFSNPGATSITGPFQLELGSLPAGVTLVNVSGMHAGVPYITINIDRLAFKQSYSQTLIFKKTGTNKITYKAKIYSGKF